MANEEHVYFLSWGVEAWNRWRADNPPMIPDLEKAHLTCANLQGANLAIASLQRADLEMANLQRANLQNANLQEAELESSNLQGANIGVANLQGASLELANLQGAVLLASNLQGAYLRGADLQGVDLTIANLQGADLRGVNLQGACLLEANLSDTDLREVKGLVLDNTLTRGARFSPVASDPWSILRRNYTGPRFLFTLLFLIAFFVPYVARTMMWIGVNRAQQRIAAFQTKQASGQGTPSRGTEDVLPDANVLLDEDRELASNKTLGGLEQINKQLKSARRALEQLRREWEQLQESAHELKPCLARDCQSYTVLEVLMSSDRSWLYRALAWMLLLYNALRGLLTWLVAPLRDEEERSGHSPYFRARPWQRVGGQSRATRLWRWSWARTEGYGWMYQIHRLVEVLGLVALVAFLVHVGDWLSLPVLLPLLPP